MLKKITDSGIQKRIQIIEKLTGRKVMIKESDEALKNGASEALKRLSEDLDTIKNDLSIAIDKVSLLPEQGVSKTKLNGLSSIIDSAMTDVSEIITELLGVQTDQDYGFNEAVTMTPDDAMKNIDDVKKLGDKDIDVDLTDDPDKNK